jgi:serine phosphatase RsbU (regulator of sigma subunit)
MPLIHVVEYALAFLAGAWYWRNRFRRDRPPAAHFSQLLLGLAAFLAVTLAWVLVASNLGPSRGAPPGVLTLFQLLRAATLGVAFAAVLALTWDHLVAKKVRWIGFLIATWLAGATGGGIGVPAFFWMVLALRKATWPQDIHGWRRVVGLVFVPLATLALFMIPVTTLGEGSASVGFTPGPDPWPAPLLSGIVSPATTFELRLIRPLDLIVSLFRAPLLAQLVLVAIQFLTLPVRLRGVGLKRRLAINYFFIRIVPATLGVLSFLLAAWAGFGLHKAAMVRAAFDATLRREAEALDHWALGDSAAGWHDAGARQEARLLLGPDGARARFLVAGPGVPAAPSAVGDSLVAAWDREPPLRQAERGMIAFADTLWLRARRPVAGDTLRHLVVFIPIDTSYLGRVARERHVDIRLKADASLFIGPTSVTTGGDTTWTSRDFEVEARYHEPPLRSRLFDRRLLLGQSFLAVDNWLEPNDGDITGAATLRLSMAPSYVVPDRRETVLLLAGNAWTLGFLLLVILVVSLTEGMAVRTGRGILNALFDDVSALRDAAHRFGKGDLDYRVPVHGKDEIATVAGAFNEMAASLKSQQAELVEKQRLEVDLALARDIQRRLLPQAPPVVSGVDLAGISIPSLEVGGDLFAFFHEGPTRLGLALGDVSGKSVPAAILMSNTLAALRAEAELAGAAAESLQRLNRILIEHFESGRFVTLVYALLDPSTGSLEFASAGHNPALLVTTAGEVEWLPASGPPLGVLPDASYEPTRRTLAPGDVLVLYSDGITEAARPPEASRASPGAEGQAPSLDDMEFFDEPRLAEVVQRTRGQSAVAIMDAVLAAVAAFRGTEPQGDDVTLLIVRYVGGGGPGPGDTRSTPTR